MFSNIKIGTRLTIGFSLILLFLILVGGTGYLSLEKMESEIVNLSGKGEKLMEYAHRSRGTINLMRRYEKDLYLNIGDAAKVEEYKKKWVDTVAQFRQDTDAISKLLDGQNDKDTVVLINKHTAVYAEGFAKVYEKIQSAEITTPLDANKAIGAYKDATHQAESLTNELAAQLAKQSKVQVSQAILTCNNDQKIMLALPVVTLTITFLLATFLTRSITGPVKKSATLVESLAKGDFTPKLEIQQKDEIGNLARSAHTLATSLDSMCCRVECSSSTINAYAHNLETLSVSLFSATETMSGSCNTVATAAEQMNANMSAIAASAEETSTNVSMVAAATEEMTATIAEIAAGSEKARIITMQAVQEAGKASTKVMELGDAARMINRVTDTINEIADQTNLLALNATIEAARAGEAGKGFAVVANEIKELAKQTTEATHEIHERIVNVQHSSEQTIAAIGNITNIINDTNEIVASMAAAVEEQAVTSKEIAANVSQAALGMQEVTENISQASIANAEVTKDIAVVKKEAITVAASSSDVKELAVELKSNAGTLDLFLDQFTFKPAQFDIGQIKTAHFNWKMRLTSVLSGYISMDSKTIPNHHQCDFGKWYDNAPENIKRNPLFKEIGVHHEAVHRKVTEAVELYNMNKTVEAQNKVEEFEGVRKKLFASLDEMFIS